MSKKHKNQEKQNTQIKEVVENNDVINDEEEIEVVEKVGVMKRIGNFYTKHKGKFKAIGCIALGATAAAVTCAKVFGNKGGDDDYDLIELGNSSDVIDANYEEVCETFEE